MVLMCRKEPGKRTRIQERGTAMQGRGGDQENQAGRKKECGWRMDGQDGKKKRRDSNVNHHDVSSLILLSPKKRLNLFKICVCT